MFRNQPSRTASRDSSGFGFPWNKLGRLYKEDPSIFSKHPKELTDRLCEYKSYGFDNVTLIGICLSFPYVLSGECKLGGEIDALFDDLKKLCIHFDLIRCVEGNVDTWYEVCRKILVFYDMGCEKGMVGELMGRSKHIFVEYSEEILVQKMEFFCRLNVKKEEVGLLILRSPEILSFDLETPMISVLDFLKHFGFSMKKLKSIAQEYPHVMGRNKMANLPHVMRALDLHEWFFNELKGGNHHLLGDYVFSGADGALDRDFKDGLDRIHSSRTPLHTISKLNFMHGIGFGENNLTMKTLVHLHGTSSELQQRFDCLLRIGVDFSKLCRIITLSPKILNQNPRIIERKVKFLCQDMGSSLEYLDVFPAFLNFDLENRIKPRYRFHMWLSEKGWCTKNYSLASMIATSEKNFVGRIYGIHPAAPKQWFECFSYKKSSNGCVKRH
ncbi:hypothetical protein L1049_018990 [Liquidambar formosana]|uniref:Uncharacterized protein n=1 Tax=Liquidambar formosana TaxID=63359 RepID=A0AAP0RAU8_LIQFO